MPTESNEEPDWSKLTFPSDGITIGAIRRVELSYYGQGNWHAWRDRQLGDFVAFETLLEEIKLAKQSFRAASGFPADPSEAPREELIDSLLERYAEYGVGAGQESRLQLIRRFEADAAAMAVTRGAPGT